jgi:hypothetical protein
MVGHTHDAMARGDAATNHVLRRRFIRALYDSPARTELRQARYAAGAAREYWWLRDFRSARLTAS